MRAFTQCDRETRVSSANTRARCRLLACIGAQAQTALRWLDGWMVGCWWWWWYWWWWALLRSHCAIRQMRQARLYDLRRCRRVRIGFRENDWMYISRLFALLRISWISSSEPNGEPHYLVAHTWLYRKQYVSTERNFCIRVRFNHNMPLALHWALLLLTR